MPVPSLLRFDRGTLLLGSAPPRPIAHLMKRDERAGAWRCDALHYAQVAAVLREEPLAYGAESAKSVRIEWPKITLTELRTD